MAVVEAVLVDRLGASNEPLWYPGAASRRRRVERALRLTWVSSFGRWPS